MRQSIFVVLGVAAWLLTPVSASAEVRAVSPTAAGAVTTSPWIATGDTITVTTLTNGSADWRTVHVQIFDEDWRAINFFCELSPMETTYFVFEENLPDEPLVSFECSSQRTLNLSLVQTRQAFGERGFVVIHEVDAPNQNTAMRWTNSLISDFVVVDFSLGASFSAAAWHIEQLAANPDGNLSFDGTEYGALSGTLATSFIAPDDKLSTLVIMYGLDGAPNLATPVRNGAYAYDDDENPLSGFHGYECFSFHRLTRVFGSNVLREFGPAGSPYFVGHATFIARSAGVGVQPVPQVGWMIQLGSPGMQLNGVGPAAAGFTSWARPMLTALDPLPSTLYGDALPPRP